MTARTGETGLRLLPTPRRITALALALLAGTAGLGLVSPNAAHATTGFTAGDVVIYRVGTGTGALSSSGVAAFLDEYTPSGTFVQSIALPTTTSGANKALISSGTATSEGLLTLSPNGQFLAATGYNAAVGTSKVGSTASTATPRTVAIVNAAGTVNTTTSLTDASTGNNIRSAVTTDGNSIWVGGAAGGVRATTLGSTTSTEIVSDPPTGTSYKNVREVNIANGQLYTSADPTKASVNVATVGTGLPTSGSLVPANLPGLPSSNFDPYEYSFLTLGSGTAPDTLYVADNTLGVIDKFTLVSGTWTANGSISVPGAIGVAANDDGSGNVTLDVSASNSAGTSGTLSVLTDTSGLGGTLSGTPTTPVTLPANEAFRGVAFAPGTVIGSGGGVRTPPVAPTISVAHTGLPATIADPTNPTDAITVADANYPASQLTVTATSGTTAVAPQSGVSVTGSGGTRTLTVTPGSTVGYSTITLTVTAPDATHTSTTVTYGLSASLGGSSDRYFSGAGNASSAIDVGGGYMIVGDDESNILRLYNETQSGPPVKTFDFTSQLPFMSTEVDIESSARAGNTLYWLGSMSNTSSGNVAPARSTLFAATISGSGANTTLTYLGSYTGLQIDLVNWDKSNGSGLGANYFGFDQSVNGGAINHANDSLEVEGMEFAHGSSSTAYLAFRGPIEPASNRQNALLIPVTDINQLVTGGASHATFGAPIQWNLGGLGIREIRANADGSYLLIAGTADGSNTSFVLYTWDGNVDHTPQPTNTSLPLTPAGTNQGSWETVVSVPDPLTTGTSVQLLEDNGDTAWYGDGATSKDSLAPDLQKDLGRTFTYSAPTASGTTTSLGSSDANASISESVTYTATVGASGASDGTPSGTVEFKDGGTDISGCAAQSVSAGGTATCVVSYQHAGSHSITAAYGGDGIYAGSTSSAFAETVKPTPVTITADDQSITYGTPDPTFTFTVTGLASGDTVTSQPTCRVAGNNRDVGTHEIDCSGADAGADYTISYAPGTLTVTVAATTVSVAANLNPAVTGQAVTLTATVSSSANAAPTGTVEFKNNGTDIAGCSAATVTAGSAVCNAPNGFAAGRHTIAVIYSGDSNFTGSDNTASPYVEVVNVKTLVVVNDNTAPQPGASNSVETLSLGAGGAWTHLDSEPTGGTGSFGDPTGSRIAVNSTDDMVYAVNYGTDTISELSLDPTNGGLTPAGSVPGPVGGLSTIAISPAGDVLYVGAQHAIAWYPIDAHGQLSNGPAGHVNGLWSPQTLAVSPDGKYVAVVQGSAAGDGADFSYPATGTLTVLAVGSGGALSSPQIINTDNVAPTSLSFAPTGTLLAGGYGGVGAYRISAGGVPSQIGFTANAVSDAIATAVAPDGSLLYASAAGGSDVASYIVASSGTLTKTGTTSTIGDSTTGFDVSDGSQAVTVGEDGVVAAYSVDGQGGISQESTATLASVGQPSVAVLTSASMATLGARSAPSGGSSRVHADRSRRLRRLRAARELRRS